MSERDLNFFMASVCDKAERYQDVIQYIKKIIVVDSNLTNEERNLFYIGYKSLVSSCRNALRAVNAILQSDSAQRDPNLLSKLQDYQQKILKELEDYCIDLLQNVSVLESSCCDNKSTIFYIKLKCDFYRYLTEYFDKEEYNQKYKEANKQLSETIKAFGDAHPDYLGIGFSRATFLYEVCGNKQEAIQLAETLYHNAMNALDELDDDQFDESSMILKMMKKSLISWKNEEKNSN